MESAITILGIVGVILALVVVVLIIAEEPSRHSRLKKRFRELTGRELVPGNFLVQSEIIHRYSTYLRTKVRLERELKNIPSGNSRLRLEKETALAETRDYLSFLREAAEHYHYGDIDNYVKANW